MTIRYVTREELQANIDGILAKYPWMADYNADCCEGCAQWDIAREHGYDAGDAWHEYRSWLFLLGSERRFIGNE